jgi:hypothetical protein
LVGVCEAALARRFDADVSDDAFQV